MQRTTIMLPEKLKMKAVQVASQRGISLGELIRDALKNSCMAQNISHRDVLFADNTTYDGRIPADLAAKHDHYLY